METKSRYEVISDLEEKKRDLIISRDSFEDTIKLREREIKNLKRDLEDKEEDLEQFKKTATTKKETIKEMIASIDIALERFNNSSSQKK